MMDERFDDLMIKAAQEYNTPPEAPRDLMWARIDAIRQERAARRQQLRVLYSPWTRWGIGLAAALAIGIGIGRVSFEGSPETQPPVVSIELGTPTEGPTRAQLAFQLVATQHLSRAETFLTSFRTDPESGEDEEFWSGAGVLLSSTRLLLDSPAAEEPVFRELLEDLELVLVQIVRFSYERGETELELVNEGMERRSLLPRLRTAIPAGSAVGVEGA